MGPDCYQVKVLHYLNPHLIWVELISDREEIDFEQIGVYGVLPMDTSFDVTGELKFNRCEKWLPAANVAMKKALKDAAEIWFSATHIDRRSSIFDDNIHKYGELIIIKTNGNHKKLSTQLVKSGFAMYDTGIFHQELSSGNIKTKLTNLQMHEVIKKLENGNDGANTKKQWDSCVKKQTSIYHEGQQIEALTIKNLEWHNNGREKYNLLENKLRDLAMCKGVDEPPIGRATTKSRVGKDPQTSSTSSREIVKSTKTEEPYTNPAHVLYITKKFLNQHGKPINNNNSISSNNVRKDSIDAIENWDLMECNDDTNHVTNDLKLNFEASPKCLEGIENLYPMAAKSLRPTEKKISKMVDAASMLPTPSSKTSHEVKPHQCIAYGPPGFDCSKLLVKIIPRDTDENEAADVTPNQELELLPPEKDIVSEIDTDINIRINNLETLKDNLHSEKTDRVKLDSNFKHNQCILENHTVKINKDNPTKSHKSNLLLQRKLKLHKEKKQSQLENYFTSESDTTNKDSSPDESARVNSNVKAQVSSDDESISDVLEKLDLPKENSINKIEYTDSEIVHPNPEINVNPFKNLDGSKSVFVDKLVTPILMVHTNKSNKILPCTNLRDIPLNSDILIALRNMAIVKPNRLQSVSWCTILRGHSTFLISPAGTGKTLGYLPAVCRLVADSSIEMSESTGPTCVIVCATAISVSEVEKLGKIFLGLKEKVLACYTGMDILSLTTSLLNGCDLLICTPSVLTRLLQTDFGIDLRRLKTLVLDDCERLSEVYSNEIKYVFYEIKKMLKSRANKESKVQIVAASRQWCDFMESSAKKAPDSVVCIGAFQECVLYSKTRTVVEFVKKENKIESVIEFLKENHGCKRTVIACRFDDEVEALENALTNRKYVVFACNNTMTLQDLYNLNVTWGNYEEPTMGPILICCDENLIHLNVTNAHYLLHYSLPPLFSAFCKRFSVLMENYASIFKPNNENIMIKVLMDDSNVEQLPKILDFVKRCTDEVPTALNETSSKGLRQKDFVKGKELIPICDNLLSHGQCADFWNCQERHTIFKEYDERLEWVPTDGVITFKILHYHGAVLYSARLLSNVVKDHTKKYSNTYSTLSLKMGTYFSKAANKKLLGIPKVGDVCAVTIKQNFYVRCQVMKILSLYQNGNPDNVLIKLIDDEKLEMSRDFYLYYLPDELKAINTYVAQVRLANVQPKDKDVAFSELAKNHLKKITDQDDDLHMRGKVVLSVGNCVFVETLEACQDLASLNETVVKYNFKKELLNAHAIPHPEHIKILKRLCNDANLTTKHEEDSFETPKQIKVLPKGRWAHLEVDIFSSVYLEYVLHLDAFFVRLLKFKDCLTSLINEINKYVSENPEPVQQVNKGDIVLANFPDDSIFERARIDDILNDNKVKCFFVDLGEWRDILTKDIVPITEKFITQIPFQAIECRLIGVKPPGEDWTEFSLNWFCDNCFEDRNGVPKEIYVKYFAKDRAEYTGGYKYGVAIIDTNSEQDVMVNQRMIDLNLARENEKEILHLNDVKVENKLSAFNVNENSDTESASETGHSVPLESVFLKKPIRSVPLVDANTEFDNLDDWDINNASNFMPLFEAKPDNQAQISQESNCHSVSVREIPEDKINEETVNNLALVTKNPNTTSILESYKSVREIPEDKNSEDAVNNLALMPKNPNTTSILESYKSISEIPKDKNSEDAVNNLALMPKNLNTASILESYKSVREIPEDKNSEDAVNNFALMPKNLNTTSILDSYKSVPEIREDKNSEAVNDLATMPENDIMSTTLDSDDFSSPETQVSEQEYLTVVDELRKPKLHWRQNGDSVSIKIQLIGVENYELLIKERGLKFFTELNDVKYGFDIELYGVIDINSSRHSSKGLYILVQLKKILKRNWLTLTKSVVKWIVYDADSVDTSSDEEDERDDTPAKVIKSIHERYESESEEEFFDDSAFRYNK